MKKRAQRPQNLFLLCLLFTIGFTISKTYHRRSFSTLNGSPLGGEREQSHTLRDAHPEVPLVELQASSGTAVDKFTGGVTENPLATNAIKPKQRQEKPISSLSAAEIQNKIREISAGQQSPESDLLLSQLFTRLGMLDPIAAIESVQALPARLREQRESEILSGWLKIDAEKAWDWGIANPKAATMRGGPPGYRYPEMVKQLASEDSTETVYRLVSRLSDSQQQMSALLVFVAALDRNGYYSVEHAMANLPSAGDSRANILGAIGARESEMSTDRGIEFITGLSSGEDKASVGRTIFTNLAISDPARAASWLAAQSSSVWLDQSLSSFIPIAAQRDPATAGRLLSSFSDENRRAKALESAATNIARRSQGSALAWLETIALPEAPVIAEKIKLLPAPGAKGKK